MKFHRTFIAIFGLLLSSAAIPAGQSENSQERTEQVQQRLQEMKDRLKLTPEQSEQVRVVINEEAQKLKALQEKHKEGGQSRRARLKTGRELRDIQSSADDKLRKILSKTQMDELKKMREERRQQLRDRASRK